METSEEKISLKKNMMNSIKAKFNDFEAPQRVMHNTVEGAVSYTSLLFYSF